MKRRGGPPLLGQGIEGLLASWEAVSRQIRDLDRLLSFLTMAAKAILPEYHPRPILASHTLVFVAQ